MGFKHITLKLIICLQLQSIVIAEMDGNGVTSINLSTEQYHKGTSRQLPVKWPGKKIVDAIFNGRNNQTSAPTTSKSPTIIISESPSIQTSVFPSVKHSSSPSVQASDSPSVKTSVSPSVQPSPNAHNSNSPSAQTSDAPSVETSDSPSVQTSDSPSVQTSDSPTEKTILNPTVSPSPTSSPTTSTAPSSTDTLSPSAAPSVSLEPSVSSEPSSASSPAPSTPLSSATPTTSSPSTAPTTSLPSTTPTASQCGNGVCDAGLETCVTCPEDCLAPTDCGTLNFIVDSISYASVVEGNLFNVEAETDTTVYGFDIMVVDPSEDLTAQVYVTRMGGKFEESAIDDNSAWIKVFDGTVTPTVHPLGLGSAPLVFDYLTRIDAGSCRGFYVVVDLYTQSLYSLGSSKSHGASSNDDITISGAEPDVTNFPGFTSLFIGSARYLYNTECVTDGDCEDGDPSTYDFCANDQCRNNEPSAVPSLTLFPSGSPSGLPSPTPSDVPSDVPSVEPTVRPSLTPSVEHSAAPTGKPTVSPSKIPTVSPTASPTKGDGVIVQIISVPGDVVTSIVDTIGSIIGGIFGRGDDGGRGSNRRGSDRRGSDDEGSDHYLY